jgi:hypothetical protein
MLLGGDTQVVEAGFRPFVTIRLENANGCDRSKSCFSDHVAFPLPRSLRADQMRTKDTEQKPTTLKVKELFVSFSRSAKPLYVGSNPTRASNSLTTMA